MLHVILLILKILGIMFLVAVGLFLLILYAVFFVAVSYRIEVRKQEDVRVSVFASWLFRVMTVRFLLENRSGWEPVFQIRLFGHPLWQNIEKEARWKRLKRFRRWVKKRLLSRLRSEAPLSRTESEPDTGEMGSEDRTPSMKRPSEESTDSSVKKTPEDVSESLADESLEDRLESSSFKETGGFPLESKTASADHTESKKKAEKRNVFQKAGYACRRIHDKIRQIWKRMTGFGDMVRKLLKRKDDLLDFWNLEEHVRARGAVLKELQYLWKKLRPKKVKGKITFGFSDPANTGICMGVAGMFCAWYPKKLKIVPDFDREILEGEIRITGKACVFVFARVLWKLYRNEDIRHMYRHWREI